MYFLGFLHSWACKDCAYADTYWRLRAFGRERNVMVTLSRRRNGVRVRTCGLTCGGSVPSLIVKGVEF